MGQCICKTPPVEPEIEPELGSNIKDNKYNKDRTHIMESSKPYKQDNDIMIMELAKPKSLSKHTTQDESTVSALSNCNLLNKQLSKQLSIQELILEEKEKEYTMEEVSKHNTADDIWIVLNNNVYDVTDFWQQHPVNPQYVFKFGGKDATDAFNSAGHSDYAIKLAIPMRIGKLCSSDRIIDNDDRKMSVVNWGNLEQTNIDENEIKIKYINVYPVKGCKGVSLDSTWIDQSGVYNDRTYCFVDADTHNPINQLKYQKLALIQPVLKNINFTEDTHSIELYYFDEKTGIKNSITVKSKYDKNEMIEIEYVNSDTKILSYDQGNEISIWITNYLHSVHNIPNKNKIFRFCKILRSNVRPHIDYFSLPFISKEDQPIKGVLNYSAINLASQESLNELNRRWHEKYPQKKDLEWNTWRVNIVLEGLPSPHFEDFSKFLTINNVDDENDVELLWNRRRYLCTVPNVIQSSGIQTNEPQQTLTRYRNAITLNDTTAKPGTNGVYFGSFFLVKQGGQIRVGDSVSVKQTQFNIVRTNRNKSYYGPKNIQNSNRNLRVKTLTQYQSYKLIDKNILTHDVYHLRFTLANDQLNIQHESIRLNIGGHYLLKIPNNNKMIIRAYTPVIIDSNELGNDNNQNNYFDLIVKIYEFGKMTQYFKKMKIGDKIDGKQYYGGIAIPEIGKFRFGDPSHYQIKHHTFNVKYINMICGGTGLAPMMQILQRIHGNYLKGNDNTKINVFYSNKTVNDVLMVDLLNNMSENNTNINVYHVITTPENNKKNENYDKNNLKITQFGQRINAEFIQTYGFKYSMDCISLLCGPPRMDIAMNKICKEIGFDEKHIHTF